MYKAQISACLLLQLSQGILSLQFWRLFLFLLFKRKILFCPVARLAISTKNVTTNWPQVLEREIEKFLQSALCRRFVTGLTSSQNDFFWKRKRTGHAFRFNNMNSLEEG
jgi:hypothetical protein